MCMRITGIPSEKSQIRRYVNARININRQYSFFWKRNPLTRKFSHRFCYTVSFPFLLILFRIDFSPKLLPPKQWPPKQNLPVRLPNLVLTSFSASASLSSQVASPEECERHSALILLFSFSFWLLLLFGLFKLLYYAYSKSWNCYPLIIEFEFSCIPFFIYKELFSVLLVIGAHRFVCLTFQ